MAGTRTLTIEILGDSTKAQGAINDLGRAANTQNDAVSRIGRTAKIAMAAGAAAAISLAKSSIDAAAESQKVAAQTEAAIKSTGGAANVSAESVGKLASQLQKLSGVSDESIQTGQNMLLTFTNIRNEVGKGNDIFDQATKAMLDYSVATGTDAQSAAVMFGKALNDPIAGLTAMGRAGVQFTDEQKKMIETLVNAGDVMGAQKIILGELNTQFGGSAKAAGDAMTPMERLSLKWGDMQERLGSGLIPKLETLAEWLGKTADWYARNSEVLTPLIVVLGSAATAVGVVAVALNVATAAAAAFGATLNVALGPIALVAAGIAALAAGLVYAYTQSDTFRNIVDTAFRLVGEAAGIMKDVVVGYFRFMVDNWLAAAEWIVKAGAKAFGWVPGIGDKLKDAARAIEKFRDDANRALGGIKDKSVRVTVEMRQHAAQMDQALINRFQPRARGGPVTAGMGYLVGEEGPELFMPGLSGGIVPNNRLAAAGGARAGGEGLGGKDESVALLRAVVALLRAGAVQTNHFHGVDGQDAARTTALALRMAM